MKEKGRIGGSFDDFLKEEGLYEEVTARAGSSSRSRKALIRKILALPPGRIAQVEDFVDFLATKERRRDAADRLLAIAPALEAAGIAPMSLQEIDAEVKAVRAARRQRAAGNDPKKRRSGLQP
ncbi:MAG: hypothetical protein K9G30_05570 [Parvibaculum sp.]|nr:hypothetical protein [Parvibaculum sp.]